MAVNSIGAGAKTCDPTLSHKVVQALFNMVGGGYGI